MQPRRQSWDYGSPDHHTVYGLLDDLDVEPLQLENRLHVTLEHIKFPQTVTTMTFRFFSLPMLSRNIQTSNSSLAGNEPTQNDSIKILETNQHIAMLHENGTHNSDFVITVGFIIKEVGLFQEPTYSHTGGRKTTTIDPNTE